MQSPLKGINIYNLSKILSLFYPKKKTNQILNSLFNLYAKIDLKRLFKISNTICAISNGCHKNCLRMTKYNHESILTKTKHAVQCRHIIKDHIECLILDEKANLCFNGLNIRWVPYTPVRIQNKSVIEVMKRRYRYRNWHSESNTLS
ncbi:hypothetical protein V6Z12_A11G327400 [Gossypium hirsutum]